MVFSCTLKDVSYIFYFYLFQTLLLDSILIWNDLLILLGPLLKSIPVFYVSPIYSSLVFPPDRFLLKVFVFSVVLPVTTLFQILVIQSKISPLISEKILVKITLLSLFLFNIQLLIYLLLCSFTRLNFISKFLDIFLYV